jgi:hypothetical protein
MGRPLVVAMRLDGVLAIFDKNRGVTEIGRPVAGAREFCRWLIDDLQCCIVVVTGRRRVDVVEQWLRNNEIPFSLINQSIVTETMKDRSGQVTADVYLGVNCVGVPISEAGKFVAAAQLLAQLRQQFNGDSDLTW